MKIILIDDDVTLAETIKHGLRREYAVDLAHDAEQSLELLEERHYDLVIIDVTLPDMNGVELCQKIRDSQLKTPILMLTAMHETEMIVQALNAGADDYLTKPFKFAELHARLRALLRRAPNLTASPILQVGALKLDPHHQTVYHQNTLVELRRKEFFLLQYFMRHPNQVITRNMILERVWDGEADLNTNTIDVHIKYLRDKIDKPFGTHYLQTIHGLGYKLTDTTLPLVPNLSEDVTSQKGGEKK
jgi:DNA-binding response OmpR family regulator